MAEPIKMRVLLQSEIADIRILMPHPMETGQRKDEAGHGVPAHFIQTFTVSLNGAMLAEGQLNTSISKNPLFGFKARGIRVGDRLAVQWIDSKGEQRRDEIVVA
ncbi:MAG TPA: thiosulfate oxidation carrier complex protein SoxZ [Rhodocyclaceae bacterium]|nr:thiosulfate oxidation carrier complex protein SoxZ [Rhodocyclaceae bacterium]